jgi:hypothetical protein
LEEEDVKERHAVASPQAYSEKEKKKKNKAGKEKNVALQPAGRKAVITISPDYLSRLDRLLVLRSLPR